IYDLRQAEAMFRSIAENSMVEVYIVHKGRFLYVNAKMADMFGYSRKEMVDTVASNRVFPDAEDGADLPPGRERLDGEQPGLWLEKQGRRQDGSLFDLEVLASLMMLDDKLVTIGIALDSTLRKECEEQTRLATFDVGN